jgi:hypothetical protein
MRTSKRFFAAGFAALLAATAAAAQSRPGVGYDPQARGFTTSSYQLDTLQSPYLHYRADFSAHPDQVGAHPDPYELNFADPAVAAAYELRWGPGTTSHRFKRWAGPNNEVRFLVAEALAWNFQQHPELMGGDTALRNGVPTEVEITDVQAFDDRQIWVSYFESELDGFSPARRVTVCDPAKPPGDGQTTEPFWGIPYYFHNDYLPPLPVSPQVPPDGSCTPP